MGAVEQFFRRFASVALVARFAHAEIERAKAARDRVLHHGVNHQLAGAAARDLGIGVVGEEQSAQAVAGAQRAEGRDDALAHSQRVKFETRRAFAQSAAGELSEAFARLRRVVDVGDAERLHAGALLSLESGEDALRLRGVGGAAMRERSERLELLDFLSLLLLRVLRGAGVAPKREIGGQGGLVGETWAWEPLRPGHRIGRALPLQRLVGEEEGVDAGRRRARARVKQGLDRHRGPFDVRPEQAHAEIGVLAAKKDSKPQWAARKPRQRQQGARRPVLVARDDDQRGEAPRGSDGLRPDAGEVIALIRAGGRQAGDRNPGLARRGEGIERLDLREGLRRVRRAGGARNDPRLGAKGSRGGHGVSILGYGSQV